MIKRCLTCYQPLDAITFFEVLVFSFLTGNYDMHLKNFSLINTLGIGYTICPAYDLVPSAILLKEDIEDMALHLNGKKHKLKKKDFITLFGKGGLSTVQADRIFQKMEASIPEWIRYLKQSFVDKTHQEKFQTLIIERAGRLEMQAYSKG